MVMTCSSNQATKVTNVDVVKNVPHDDLHLRFKRIVVLSTCLVAGGVPWGKHFWANIQLESHCPKRKQVVHGSTIPDMSRYLQTLSKMGESPQTLCVTGMICTNVMQFCHK